MSPRYSSVTAAKIDYSFWLVFDDAGGMRFSRGEPALARNERAMSCRTILPRALFRTPTLRATINVTEGGETAFALDVSAVSDALKQAIGCDVDLKILPACDA
jgi:hypothetical protein